MKILVTITMLCSLMTFSQSETEMENDFVGALQLEDQSFVTYRLQFNIKDNKLLGVSYTNMQGADETKSNITGTYHPKEKKISFEESGIVYTKSKELPASFCYVKAIATLNLKKKKPSLSGNFIGLLPNKDTCAVGKITLMSSTSVFKKFEKLSKIANKIKKLDAKQKEKINPEKLMTVFKPKSLKKDEEMRLFWNSPNFVIEIWDNGKEDGDQITMTHNGKLLLKKYEVKKAKKRLELPLIEGSHIFEITANSEGTIPPNTAKVVLIDGENTHSFSTHLQSRESSKIKIYYAQPKKL